MTNELTFDQLGKFYKPEQFALDSTEESILCDEIIGQERAAKALKFGLNIKTKGYNIYVMGTPGTGRTTYAKHFAEEIAKNESIPHDMCYVYNFENPKNPCALAFEAGKGKEFVADMEEFLEVLQVEIPKLFSSLEYEKEKNKIVKVYQDKRDAVIKQMTDEAKEYGFGVKMSNTGIYFLPIVGDVTISEEDYDALDEEQKAYISENSEIIQEKAADVMRLIKEFEKETKKNVEDREYNLGLFTLSKYLSPIQEKYVQDERVSSYLVALKEDVLDNLYDFIEEEFEEEESLQLMLPWMNKRTKEDCLAKYKVNLLVDNSSLTHAPVIVDFNPTYSNLIGEIEYDSEFGNLTTDFMKIKPGLIHKANGGYLILHVTDILGNPYVWETLRRVLKTNEIVIEPMREYLLSGMSVTSIKPEAIAVDVKVILVGNDYYYDVLSEYDDDFLKLFKISAQFDYEMQNDSSHLNCLVQYIKNFSAKENILPLEMEAVCTVLTYSSRLAETQDKLTTKFSQMNELLFESSAWAKMDNEQTITKEYILKTIREKEYRDNLYEEKLNEMMDNNTIMIDTEGAKIGQINGLAVLDTGAHVFGKPAKITATTYLGKAGIINIEKEAEMSGSIHDKGVQVLIGYLGQKYAQEFPLSLSCRIGFEQNYHGIDGDSASSTELYCIMSSLADLPITQEIAVTGSINQRGDIQPIGGVTFKIEGFFELCRKRGLTGKQGVIIPWQNVRDLVLKEEVVEAVRDGLFHIYPIRHVDEGIELLMNTPASIKNAKGKFTQACVHGKVMKKLAKYFKKSMMDTE